ncbi:glycosyltransferase family 2 protein [Paenibacillus hamazuiensis]|uniref:glycosyltransferase family 2 protein n=1 Tax=Paenibacillus hamazuiensis TaxID=2936508 RepID=UPI00200F14AE|nr:glycosyltransferase family 2 protein [Paenibacillus hamazuiensis]
MLTTPVALFIFKRPETTARVFEEIRKAQPQTLFVIADGPRADRPGEAEECMAARAVVSQVDWPCDVRTNFSDVNLGCDVRITSGLDWLFGQVEEAIVLEDDCLPHPTFFPFCQELLEHYRHDSRVMMISGNNFQAGRKRTGASYYYSRLFHIWGWATWRRAWQHFDAGLARWPEIRGGGWLADVLADPLAARFFGYIYDRCHAGEINPWDYRWNFSCWLQNGVSIAPNVNLVSNIGFGADAVHATNPDDRLAEIPVQAMEFPLAHPGFMIPDTVADRRTMQQQFYLPEDKAGRHGAAAQTDPVAPTGQQPDKPHGRASARAGKKRRRHRRTARRSRTARRMRQKRRPPRKRRRPV